MRIPLKRDLVATCPFLTPVKCNTVSQVSRELIRAVKAEAISP